VNQDVSIVLSAPSSAYYSDLSNAPPSTERAYEIVDLSTIPQPPLDSICESNGVTSPMTILVVPPSPPLLPLNSSVNSTSHIIDGDSKTRFTLLLNLIFLH
jgi:hypothetical protein